MLHPNKLRQPKALRAAADRRQAFGGLMSIPFGIALGLILTLANLEAFGFGLGGLIALCHLLVVPMFGCGLVVAGRRKRHGGVLRFGVATLLAAVLSLVVSSLWVASKEAASKELGDSVCTALASWRASNGSYPSSLHELVPDILAEIPMKSMGVFSVVPFRYTRDSSGDDYILGFDSTSGVVCARRAATTWRCDV
jgi:hypothetical protein